MPGNYTFEEYLLLIASAESADELRLIDEQLQEDRNSKLIDVFQYIDLKGAWTLRLVQLTIDQAERDQA